MKNFTLFTLISLLSAPLGFGMQKQYEHIESTPTVSGTHKTHTIYVPLIINANAANTASQLPATGNFDPNRLVNLQEIHAPAVPHATRQEQIFNSFKTTFITWSVSGLKTFQDLTQANAHKIKNFSYSQLVDHKSFYQKELAKSVDAYNDALNLAKPETRAMLHHERQTNAQWAAQAMEKQVLKDSDRLVCYTQAGIIKEKQLVIEIQQQIINDCDQRIEQIKTEAIEQIRPIIEKISTESLVTYEIPMLEQRLHELSIIIQRYEKNPDVLAEYRTEYHVLLEHRKYMEKVVQLRRTQEKFEQLKELQVLFNGFNTQLDQLSPKEQQLIKAAEKAALEEGKNVYQINAHLTQEAKDWLTKCGIQAEQFQNMVYLDALQAHIGNEIITSINAIAKQEMHAVVDMETKEFIGITRDAFALASEANVAGNPVEAVALLKIATTFEQAAQDAIKAKAAQATANVKAESELCFDVTSLKQAFDMLASKVDLLSDDAKIALQKAYETFDNLPPQEKFHQFMAATAFALFSSRITLGSKVLTAVIRHAVKILPMVHARSIMQQMGQAVVKGNPKAATSAGPHAAAGAGAGQEGRGGTIATKEVQWTRHDNRHVPPKNVAWKDIIKQTENGNAKYKPDINIEALERKIWSEGVPTNDGKTHKVFDCGKIIGAYKGKETQYVIIKCSANEIHGHPISYERYKRLINK